MTDSVTPESIIFAAEAAGFAAHVDLDHVGPGAPIRATWAFRNSGTAIWDGRCLLVYSDTPHPETAGNSLSPMGAATVYPLAELEAPAQVKPGELLNLTVILTAPGVLGTHATNWQLATPEGERFGPIRWLRAVVTRAEELTYEVLGFRNSAGDFNNLQPGQQFSATWTMRNTGTRTWDGNFHVVYLDESVAEIAQTPRDRMSAKPVYSLRQVSGQDAIPPGAVVTLQIDLIAPLAVGAYAFHWQLTTADGLPFGGIRWLRIGVMGVGPVVDPSPARPSAVGATEFGMNINPDAHGPDVDRLGGLNWVRWVFFASRLGLSPEEAYHQKYRSLIQTYAAAGIRSLIILHQDTEWGNAPWQNGGWEQYARTFAKACGRVAALCSEFGDQVAYQIFNEQDSGPDNRSAIGIKAEDYALVLDSAQETIRRAHPDAVVVLGGLNTGPEGALKYLKAVQARLNGRLPVDALAVHPYGRYVRKVLFNYGSIGKLADSLNRFRKAYPDLPLWITEIGVANDTTIGPEHYADIGVYIREVVDEVADNFVGYVPVLIWFGWTDLMRNAGILTADGRPKRDVFDAFEYMKARGREALESLAATGLEALDRSVAEFKSFSTTLDNHTAVQAGTTFTNRWRFRNGGATIWGDGYRLVFVSDGANSGPMMAQTSFDLSAVASGMPVVPGAETEISLTMTAPAAFGRIYRSRWQLRDADGTAFGHLYAEITVIPAPPPPAARPAGMTYAQRETIPDGSRFVTATDFVKQWVVRNTGERHWGSGFRLVFVQGDAQMAHGVMAHIVPPAKPSEEVVLSVPMTAPPALNGQATEYRSTWRMQDDRGAFFGNSLWVKIVSTPGTPVVDGEPLSGIGALGRLLNDPSAWYSQLDPRWSETVVGHGPQRMEDWGCLVTCMAMTLAAFNLRLDPAQLNDRLKTVGEDGFKGSNVQFLAPTAVLPTLRKGRHVRSYESPAIDFTEWLTEETPLARLDRLLSLGYVVLAQVDSKPNNGLFDSNIEQHWVIVVKRTPNGDDYLILDPVVPADQVLEQPRSLMVKYGNRLAGRSNDDNLRDALKSTLVYYM